MNELQERHQELVKQIENANYAYYVCDAPTISDKQYDRLFVSLLLLEKEHPDLCTMSSPTQRIGNPVPSKFEKINHLIPMYSLDNAFTTDDLGKFIESNGDEETPSDNVSYTIEWKYDGLSLSVIYMDGKFVRAVTRGDGNEGEDVSEQAKTIKNLPLELPYAPEGIFEVRGEVVIAKAQLERVNKKRGEEGLQLYSNCRNLAAGSLRNENSSITAERGLIFFAWGLGYVESNLTDIGLSHQHTTLFNLVENGFSVGEFTTNNGLGPIVARILELEKLRPTLKYDVDGVVIKVSSFSKQQELGFKSRSPRFAIAFKFAAVTEFTKLLSITWQLGRTGQITPVAELEKVNVGGVNITRATLHNIKQIRDKDLHINDIVAVARAGDVIPEIVCKAPTSHLQDNLLSIVEPTHCPVCNTLTWKTDTGLLFCQNNKCNSRLPQRVIHFCSRDAMNIEGLGPNIIEYLCEEEVIKELYDIYHIEYVPNKFLALKKLGEGIAFNIIDAIKKSKNVKLENFIYALGIPSVGKGTSSRLVKAFGSLEKIREATYDELVSVKDIGERTANDILQFFEIEGPNVNRLLNTGIIIEQVVEGKKFLNMSFCITGTLSQARSDVERSITENGGTIASVSKNLTYLVIGENAGSKLDKAKQLGIKIITEEELSKLFI